MRHPRLQPRAPRLAKTTARRHRKATDRSGPPDLLRGFQTALSRTGLLTACAEDSLECCLRCTAPALAARPAHTKYFSIKIPSFCLVASGTCPRSVIIAWASAEPHLQARATGISATASA